MRIVSWNIHGAPAQGTNREQERAWHHLASLDADLVMLQEVRASTVPAWASDEWELCIGESGVCGKQSGWGSGIAAKRELNLRQRSDLIAEGEWLGMVYDYVVVAEVDLAGTSVLVASVHAPATSAAKMFEMLGKPDAIDETSLREISIPPDEPWSTDVIFHALQRVNSDRFIFGGDWNTARLFDRNKAVPTNALFFARAIQEGWVEAMGEMNETQSFFRKDNLPYQLDHIFLDRLTAEAQESCRVLSESTARDISDHAPVVLDLNL